MAKPRLLWQVQHDFRSLGDRESWDTISLGLGFILENVVAAPTQVVPFKRYCDISVTRELPGYAI